MAGTEEIPKYKLLYWNKLQYKLCTFDIPLLDITEWMPDSFKIVNTLPPERPRNMTWRLGIIGLVGVQTGCSVNSQFIVTTDPQWSILFQHWYNSWCPWGVSHRWNYSSFGPVHKTQCQLCCTLLSYICLFYFFLFYNKDTAQGHNKKWQKKEPSYFYSKRARLQIELASRVEFESFRWTQL